MPSLPSPFCSNNSRTLSALRGTVCKRFTADAILIQKNSDLQNTSGKGRKNEGVQGPPLPFPDYVGHPGYVMKATFKCSALSILPNLVVIANIVLKRKLLQTFSVISVQVRIFTSLDRNDLKYSFRISEIILSMNAKVLFLVICLASTILYVTRHLVIHKVLCIISWTTATQRKKSK